LECAQFIAAVDPDPSPSRPHPQATFCAPRVEHPAETGLNETAAGAGAMRLKCPRLSALAVRRAGEYLKAQTAVRKTDSISQENFSKLDRPQEATFAGRPITGRRGARAG